MPYLLSYLMQTLYGMADLLIVGRFEGVAASTAVSVGSQVMHLVTVLVVGLAMYILMQFAAEPVVGLFTDAATAGGAFVVLLRKKRNKATV